MSRIDSKNQRKFKRNPVASNRRHRCRPTLMALEDRQLLSTFTVENTLNDNNPGSLRWAIGQANTAGGANTIDFDTKIFATAQTINLGGTQLELGGGSATTIQGPAAGVVLSGDGGSRVLEVDAGVTASISGVTITSGSAVYGGGIANYGNLSLIDATVQSNSATAASSSTDLNPHAGGGGIFNQGTLSLADVTVSGNTASSSVGYGGGIWNDGSLAIQDSLISSNSTDASFSLGGGVFNGGSMTATNTTIAMNLTSVDSNGGSSFGGGIENDSTLSLICSTVSGNTISSPDEFGDGGGIDAREGSVSLSDTIVAGNFFKVSNSFSDDIFSQQLVSGSYNLIGTGGSGGLVDGVNGNIVGVANPLVAPLGNNGGPTLTMALIPGSPAINAGSNALAVDAQGHPLTTDQRGQPRIAFGTVDIGAYERQTSNFASIAITPTAPTVVLGLKEQFTATATEADGSKVDVTNSVTWASATPSVATVDSTGLASTFGQGTTVVTASVGGVTSPGATLTVTPANLVSIAVSPSNPVLLAGSTEQFTATGTYTDGSIENLTHSVVWASSLQSVATINGSGLASGVGDGQTVITASLDSTTSPGDDLFVTSVFVVNTTADELGSPDGKTSLRQAIAEANASPSGGQIVFDPTVFAKPQTITLTLGQLDLNNTTGAEAIIGPDAGLTINGNNASRVIEIEPGATAVLSGLTITGGRTGGTNFQNFSTGGAGVYDRGTATLFDCTISGNSSTGLGGGVGALGYGSHQVDPGDKITAALTMTDCTVSGNYGGYFAGGVSASGAGVDLTSCTISDNSAPYVGGGLFLDNTPYVPDTLTNCTIVGNSAKYSGGIAINLGARTTLTNCTVTGNTGYGIRGYGSAGTPHDLILNNTIVAGNVLNGRPSDCLYIGQAGNTMIPTVIVGSNNLIGTGGSGGLVDGVNGNIVGVADPLLGPLQDNGGPTQTIALLTGSPAIDAGNNSLAVDAQGNPLTTDQRGSRRIENGIVDIGAYELLTTHFISIAITPTTSSVALGVSQQFTAIGTEADGSTDDVTRIVTWASASPYVARVDATGLASTFGQGTTVVTASIGGVTSPGVTLTVTPAVLASIAVVPVSPAIQVGSDEQFTATATYTDGSTRDVTDSVMWASSSTTVATISLAGLALGQASGTSEITASLSGLTSPEETLSVYASSIVVNTTADETGSTDCKISLREAIAEAEASPFPVSIAFDPTVFATAQTITLTLGQLELDKAARLVIQGPTAGLMISGGGSNRVFEVDPGVTASLSDLTISNGYGKGAGLYDDGGTVTLDRCTISGNSGSVGAGIFVNNGATISLDLCTVSNNNSEYGIGGGIEANGSILSLTDCTITGNHSVNPTVDYGSAGGIGATNGSSVTLTRCTVSGNVANPGGGLYISNGSEISLVDSTVSGNTSYGNGGGVWDVGGTLSLTDSTISGNASGNAGGIGDQNGTVILNNCNLYGNSTYGGNGGGALYQDGGTAVLDHCTLSGNSVNSEGGALYASQSAFVVLIDCTISGNSGSSGGRSSTQVVWSRWRNARSRGTLRPMSAAA